MRRKCRGSRIPTWVFGLVSDALGGAAVFELSRIHSVARGIRGRKGSPMHTVTFCKPADVAALIRSVERVPLLAHQ